MSKFAATNPRDVIASGLSASASGKGIVMDVAQLAGTAVAVVSQACGSARRHATRVRIGRSRRGRAAVVGAILLLGTAEAFAATTTWSGASNNNWSTNGNWSNNAPGAGDLAQFNSNPTRTSTVNNTFSINQLLVTNGWAGANAQLTVANNLTITGAGGSVSVDLSGGGTFTNNATIIFSSNNNMTIASTGAVDFGDITVNFGNAARTLTLNTDITCGVLTVTQGIVELNGHTITCDRLVVNGGTVQNSGAARAITVIGTANPAVNITSGAVTLNGALTVNANGFSITGGTFTPGANTVTIAGGTFNVGGGTFNAATGATGIQFTGTVTWNGTGTNIGNVTVASGANTVSLTANQTVTNFSMSTGTLTPAANAILTVTTDVSVTGGTFNTVNTGTGLTFSGGGAHAWNDTTGTSGQNYRNYVNAGTVTVSGGSTGVTVKIINASTGSLNLGGKLLTLADGLDASTNATPFGTTGVVITNGTFVFQGGIAQTVETNTNILSATVSIRTNSAFAHALNGDASCNTVNVAVGSLVLGNNNTLTTAGGITITSNATGLDASGTAANITCGTALSGSGTLNMGTNTISVAGNCDVSGLTLTASPTRITLTGNSSNFVPAVAAQAILLTVSMTAGQTATVTTRPLQISAAGSVLVSSGILSLNTGCTIAGGVTVNGASAQLTDGATAGQTFNFNNAATTLLKTLGTVSFTGAGGTINIVAAGTVTNTSNASGAFNVSGGTLFGADRITLTSTATWTLADTAAITVSGVIAKNSNATGVQVDATNECVDASPGGTNTNWNFGAKTLIFTNGGGNNIWSNPANWDVNQVPANGDSVAYTGPGFALAPNSPSQIDITRTLSSVDTTGLGTAGGSVTINPTFTLTTSTKLIVDAAFNVNGQTLTNNGTLTVNTGRTLSTGASGTITCASTTTLTGPTGTIDATGAGIVNLNNATAVAGTGRLVMADGSLNVSGATANFSGLATFSWTSGTLTLLGTQAAQNFTVSNSQSLGTLTINHTTLGTDAINLAGTPVTVTGTLNVTRGTLNVGNGNTLNVTGVATLTAPANGGTLNTGTGTLTLAATPVIDGVLNATGGTVNLNAASAVSGAGTLTMATGALNVSGGTANFSGLAAFTWSSGTLTLQGTAATQNFTVSNGQSLGILTINHTTLGTDAINLAGTPIAVTGTLNVTRGTLNVGNGNTLSVTGVATMSVAPNGGTLNTNTGTLNLAATPTINGTLNGSGGLVNLNNTTTAVSGAGTLTMNDGVLNVSAATANFSGLAAFNWTTGNLTLQGAAVTQNFTVANSQVLGALGVNHTTLGSDNVNMAGTPVTVSGNFDVQRGTFNVGNGNTLNVTGVPTITGGAQGGTLTTGTGTLTLASTPNIAGVLDGTGGTVNLNAATAVSGAGTLTMATGALNVSGATANFSGLGAFNWSSGTLTLRGTAATQNFTVASSQSLGTLTINHTTLGTDAINLAGTPVTVTGTLNVTRGTFNVGNGNTLIVTGVATMTAPANGGTLNTGTGTLTLTATPVINGVLNATGGTVNLNAATAVSGTGTLTMATGALNVSGGTANFSGLGAFTWSTGTLTLQGTAATQNFTVSNSQSLGTLTINHTTLGTDAINLAGTPVTVTGTLNVTRGTLNVGNGNTLNVTGVATLTAPANGGTVNTGTGTLTLAATPVISGTLNVTGGTLNLNNATSAVSGAGTLTAATGTIHVLSASADFSSLAGFTWTSGTLSLEAVTATGAQTLKVATPQTLGALTINRQASSDQVNLDNGAATTVTVSQTLNVTVGTLNLQSGNVLNVTGVATISAGQTLDATGATINLNNTTTVIAGAGIFTVGSGTVNVFATAATFSGLGAMTFTANSGTLNLRGTGAAQTFTPKAAVGNLGINLGAAGNVMTAQTALTINGTTTVTQGIFEVPLNATFGDGSTVSAVSILGNGILRDTTGPSRTFTFNGTVSLAGGGDFTFTAASCVLHFTAGATGQVTVDGAGSTFTISGTPPPHANRTTVDSLSGGTQWLINNTNSGVIAINGVILSDSNTTNGQTTDNSVPGAFANTNWTFGPKTITWTQAGAGTFLWSTPGNWDTNSVPLSTDNVVFGAVTNTSVQNIPGLNLGSLDTTNFGGTLRIDNTLGVTGNATLVATTTCNTGGLTVGGTLNVGTAAQAGTLNTGNNTVSVTGVLTLTSTQVGTVNVNNGGALTLAATPTITGPNGVLDASGGGTINLNNTATAVAGTGQIVMGAGTLNVRATAANFSGNTFSWGTTGTLNMLSGTPGNQTLTVGAGQFLGILQINHNPTTEIVNIVGSPVTIQGSLNVISGTLNPSASTTVLVDFLLGTPGANGLLTPSAAVNINVKGNYTQDATNSAVTNPANVTVTFNGQTGVATAQTFTPRAGIVDQGNLAVDLNNSAVKLGAALTNGTTSGARALTFGTTGGTTTFDTNGFAARFSGNISVTAGTGNFVNSNATVIALGNVQATNWSSSGAAAALVLQGTATKSWGAGTAGSYGAVTINATGAYQLTTSNTSMTSLTIGNAGGVGSLNLNGFSPTCTGTLLLGNGNNGTLSASTAGTIDVRGSYTQGANAQNVSTSVTVRMNSGGTQVLTPLANTTVGNLIVDFNGVTATTVNLAATLISAGTVDVRNGSTFNLATFNATFTGNVTTGAGTGTLTGSGNVTAQASMQVRTYSVTGTLRFTTTGGTWSSAAAPQTYGDVTIDGAATVSLGSAVRVTALTVGSTGVGTINLAGQTLDMATGSTGDFNLGNGATAGTLNSTASGGVLRLLGDYTQSAAAVVSNPANVTVVFNATSVAQNFTPVTGVTDQGNIQVAGTTNSATIIGGFAGPVVIRALSVSGGDSFVTGTKAVTFNGAVSGAGTLDASTSTGVICNSDLTVSNYSPGTSLRFQGSGAWSGTGSPDYGAVTIENAATTVPGSTVTAASLTIGTATNGTLQWTSAQTVNVKGNVTIGNAAGTGRFDPTTFAGQLFVGGNELFGANASVLSPANLTTTFNSTTAIQSLTPRAVALDIGNVRFNNGFGGTGVTIQTNPLTCQAFTILAGTVTQSIDVLASRDVSLAGGTLSQGSTRTFTFNGGATAQTLTLAAGNQFGGNIATATASTAVTVAGSPLVVVGTTTIAGSTQLNVAVSGASFTGLVNVTGSLNATGTSITCRGGLTVAGTYTKGTLLTLDAPGGNWSGGSDFGAVTVAGGTQTLQSDIALTATTPTIVVSGGTLDLNNFRLTLTTTGGGTSLSHSAGTIDGHAASNSHIDLNGDIVQSGSAAINNPTSLTVTFTGAGTRSLTPLASINQGNLVLSAATSLRLLTGVTMTAEKLTVGTGSFLAQASSVIFNDNVTSAVPGSGGTLSAGTGASVTCKRDLTIDGFLKSSAAGAVLNLSTPGGNWGSSALTKPDYGKVAVTANVTVTSNLTVSAAAGSPALQISSGTSNLQLGNGNTITATTGDLQLGPTGVMTASGAGSTIILSAGDYNVNDTGSSITAPTLVTVRFSRGGPQLLTQQTGVNVGNLDLTVANTTVTLNNAGSNLTAGTVSVNNASNTLDLTGEVATFNGLVSGPGRLLATGSATVTLNAGLVVGTYNSPTQTRFNGSGNWSTASDTGPTVVQNGATITLTSVQSATMAATSLQVTGTSTLRVNGLALQVGTGGITFGGAGTNTIDANAASSNLRVRGDYTQNGTTQILTPANLTTTFNATATATQSFTPRVGTDNGVIVGSNTTPGGSVALLANLTCKALQITAGTFDATTSNVTVIGGANTDLSGGTLVLGAARTLTFDNPTASPLTINFIPCSSTIGGLLALTTTGGSTLLVDVQTTTLTIGGTTSVATRATLRLSAPADFKGSVTVANALGATLDARADATFEGTTGGTCLTVGGGTGGSFVATTNAIILRFKDGALAKFPGTVNIAPPSPQHTQLLSFASPAKWTIDMTSNVSQTFTRVQVQDSLVAGADAVATLLVSPDESDDLGGNTLFPTSPGWRNLTSIGASWTGAFSTDWNDDRNWTFYPVTGSSVLISLGTATFAPQTVGSPIGGNIRALPTTFGSITIGATFPAVGNVILPPAGPFVVTGSISIPPGRTFSTGSQTLQVGSVINNGATGGTFINSNSAVTVISDLTIDTYSFVGVGPTLTFSTGTGNWKGALATANFGNVSIINGASVTLTQNLRVDSLAINQGTLDVNARTLTVNPTAGTFSIGTAGTTGTLRSGLANGSVLVGTTYTQTAGRTSLPTPGNLALTLNRGAAQSFTPDATQDQGAVTIAGGTSVTLGAGVQTDALTITGSLNAAGFAVFANGAVSGAGALNAASSAITCRTDLTVTTFTSDATTSVDFNGAVTHLWSTASASVQNYGNVTSDGAGTLRVNSANLRAASMTIASGGTTGTLDVNGNTLDVTGDVNLGAGATAGTLTNGVASAATLNIGGNYTQSAGAVVTVTNPLTINFDGAGPQDFTPLASITNQGSITLTGGTVRLLSALVTSGTVNVGATATLATNGRAATFNNVLSGGGAVNATLAGSVLVSSSDVTVTTFTSDANTTLTFTGAGAHALSSASAPQNYGALTVNGGATLNLGSAVDTNGLTVNGGGTIDIRTFPTRVLNGGAFNLGVGSNGTLDSSTGVGTVSLTGNYTQGANALIPALTAGNLSMLFNGTAAQSFTPKASLDVGNVSFANSNVSGVSILADLTCEQFTMVSGIVNSNAASITASGTVDLVAGTFTLGAARTLFLASTVAQTIRPPAAAIAGNLDCTATAGTTLISAAVNPLNIAGTTVIHANTTLRTVLANGTNFTGAVSGAGGALDTTGSNVTVRSSLTVDGFVKGGAGFVLTFNPSALATWRGTANPDYGQVVVSTNTVQLTSAVTVSAASPTNAISVSGGATLDLNSQTLNCSGNLSVAGTLNQAAGTGGTVNVSGNAALGGATVNSPTATTFVFNGTGTQQLTPPAANMGNLQVNSGGADNVTLLGALQAQALTVTNNTFTTAGFAATFSGDVTGAGTLNASSSAITVRQALTVTSFTSDLTTATNFTTTGGAWSTPAAATQNYGAVTITGVPVQLGTASRIACRSLSIAGSGSLDVHANVLFSCSGNLSIGPGTLDSTTGAGQIALQGDYTQSAGTVINNPANLTVFFNGNKGLATPQSFTPLSGLAVGNLAVSLAGTKVNLLGTLNTAGLLTFSTSGVFATNGNAATFTGMVSGAGTLDASGGGNIVVQNGLTASNFSKGAGTLTFTGGGTWSGTGLSDYGAVVINNGASVLQGATGLLATTLQINQGGSLTLGNGLTVTVSGAFTLGGTGPNTAGTIVAPGAGNATLAVGGTYTQNSLAAITNASFLTQNLNGGAQTWDNQAALVQGNVTCSTAGTKTVSATLLARNLSVSGGTLDTSAGNVTVTGDVTITTGLFVTGGTRTFTFQGSGGTQTWNPGTSPIAADLQVNGGGGSLVVVTGAVGTSLVVNGSTTVASNTTLRVDTTANSATFAKLVTLNGTLEARADTAFTAAANDLTVNSGGQLLCTTGGVTFRFQNLSTVTVNGGGTIVINPAVGSVSLLPVTDSNPATGDVTNDWLLNLNSTPSGTFFNVNVRMSDAQSGAAASATGSSTDLGNNRNWGGLNAVNVVWRGTQNDGDWSNPLNYFPAIRPLANSQVVFDATSNANVAPSNNTQLPAFNQVGAVVVQGDNTLTIALPADFTMNGNVTLATPVGTAAQLDLQGHKLTIRGTLNTFNTDVINSGAAQTIVFASGGVTTLGIGAGTTTAAAFQVSANTTNTSLTLSTATAVSITALTVDASQTFSTGALNANLTITGNTSVAGTLNLNQSVAVMRGDVTATGTLSSVGPAGDLQLQGPSAQAFTPGSGSLNNLTISKSGGSVAATGPVNVNNVLVFAAANQATVTLGSGTLTVGNAVNFNGSSGGLTVSAGASLAAPTAPLTFTGTNTGGLNASGAATTVTVQSIAFNAGAPNGSVVMATGATLTVNGNVTAAAGSGASLVFANSATNRVTGSVSFPAGSGTSITLAGTVQVDTNFDVAGASMTAAGSTLRMAAGGAASINLGGSSLGALALTGAGPFTMLSTLNMSGNLTMSGGNLTLTATAGTIGGGVTATAGQLLGSGGTLTVGNDWNFSGAASFDVTTTATVVRFTTAVTLHVTPGASIFGSVIATGGGTVQLLGATSAATFDFSTGRLDMNAQTLVLTGRLPATLLVGATGNFIGAGSTVRFQPLPPVSGTATCPIPALGYNNLVIDDSGNGATVSFATGTGQTTAGGTLTFQSGKLTLNGNLTANAIQLTGSGTIDANTASAAVLIRVITGTIAQNLNLVNLVSGSTLSTVQYDSAVAVNPATYGNLTLTATTGNYSVAGGSPFHVQGSLSLNSDIGGADLLFDGALSGTFAANNLNGCNVGNIVINKATPATFVGFAGPSPSNVARQVTGTTTIQSGTLDLQSDYTFSGNINVGTGSADTSIFNVSTPNVALTLGAITVDIHNTMIVGAGTGGLKLTMVAGTILHLSETISKLNFFGANASKLAITSGQIDCVQANQGFRITATNVSVTNNNANGVVDGAGTRTPIQATSSADGGGNLNWDFQGGGVLFVVAASTIGDGAGHINRVRFAFSRAISASTIGNVHQQFRLQQLDSSGNILQSITGTTTSLVQSAANDKLEVVFGNGLGRTDTANVRVAYVAPTGGFLTSFDGIPASQDQFMQQFVSPAIPPLPALGANAPAAAPLVDSAEPVLVSAFAQDVDGNGGLDRIQFVFTERPGFAPSQGVSLSGFGPSTDTTTMNTNTFLYLQIAGEVAPPIKIDQSGAVTGGDQIASAIQTAVRRLVNPVTVGFTHDRLNRPAYNNFTCTFADGRYRLQAGVPIRFNAGTSSYFADHSASSVVVLTDASLIRNAAPLLRLGTANDGVEKAGSGTANFGMSASAAIVQPAANLQGKTASFAINGENMRDYLVPSVPPITSFDEAAIAIEKIVRGQTTTPSEPLAVSNTSAYANFVCVPDLTRNRLVFVSGNFGPGSSVLFDSQNSFAQVALIGSANYALGALETNGAANTLVSIQGLTIRGADGSNLLLGKSVSDLTVSNNIVTMNLTNVPGSGTGTPGFYWSDPGDGAFLVDRANVPNRVSGTFTNTSGSNVVIAGANSALQVPFSPGKSTLDASQTIAFVGTQGATTTFQWTFLSGPSTPTTTSGVGTTFPFEASVSGAYFFQLSITVVDGAGVPVVSNNTDAQGRQTVVIEVDVTSQAPVASAGPSSVVVGASAQLDGTGSFDPNGGPVTVLWSAVDQNTNLPVAQSAFDDPTSLTPTFTPSAPGVFLVTITVTKPGNPTPLTSSSTTQITIADPATLLPTADAGPNRVVRINVTVTLDGSASQSPGGGALTYAWSVLSSPSPVTLSSLSAVRPTFIPSAPGAFVFQLVVSTSTATSAPKVVTLNCVDDTAATPRRGPAAEPRIANTTLAIYLPSAPADLRPTTTTVVLADGSVRPVAVVDLTATPSDDPTPDEVKAMRRIDVVVSNQVFANLYVPLQQGDDEPASVKAPNGTSTEIVSFGVVGQATPLILDGTRSHSDGAIATFTWKQLSGPFLFSIQSGELIAITPPTAGLYVFQLVTTDNTGLNSFPRTVKVAVLPANLPGIGPPKASVGVTSGATVVTPATAVQPLVAATGTIGGVTLSTSGSSARGGGVLTFSWKQLSGPIAVLGALNTDTLTVTPKTAGAYQFEVTVTDANGVADTSIVWVTIGGANGEAPVAVIRPVEDQTIPIGGSVTVSLDANGSKGSGTLTYIWSQLEGVPVVVNERAGSGTGTIKLDQPGAYEFAVQVSDGTVTSSPAIVRFQAQNGDQPALVSGTSTTRKSGGCAIESGAPDGAWLAWLPLLGVGLIVMGGRRATRGVR